MNNRILFISSIYSGSLGSFYRDKNDLVSDLSYDKHCNILFESSTEFIASYIRCLRQMGIDAHGVIVNDKRLQLKWSHESGAEDMKSMDLLFKQVTVYQPEILWIDNVNYVNRDWLEKVRYNIKSIRLIVGYHCSPFNPKILNTLSAVDIIITCTPGLKADFDHIGGKTFLVYHGFDDTLLTKINADIAQEYDLVFSGSLTTGGKFHDERRELLEAVLKEKVNISLFVNLEKRHKILAKQMIFLLSWLFKKTNSGKLIKKTERFDFGQKIPSYYSRELLSSCQNPYYGFDMYNLFRKSKIVLNMHLGMSGIYAGNMRLFEVTGVGSCLLTDNKKNIGEIFKPGEEIVVYDDAKDCINKARWLLKNEKERTEIARAGQIRTLKSHTVRQRCEQILEIIEKEVR